MLRLSTALTPTQPKLTRFAVVWAVVHDQYPLWFIWGGIMILATGITHLMHRNDADPDIRHCDGTDVAHAARRRAAARRVRCRRDAADRHTDCVVSAWLVTTFVAFFAVCDVWAAIIPAVSLVTSCALIRRSERADCQAECAPSLSGCIDNPPPEHAACCNAPAVRAPAVTLVSCATTPRADFRRFLPGPLIFTASKVTTTTRSKERKRWSAPTTSKAAVDSGASHTFVSARDRQFLKAFKLIKGMKCTVANTDVARGLAHQSDESAVGADKENCRKKAGAALGAAITARPELRAAVPMRCKYMARPTKRSCALVDHCIRFLASTPHHGITYSCSSSALHNLASSGVSAWCDANWAGDVSPAKNTTGVCLCAAGAEFELYSRPQRSVLMSSTESECIALASAVIEVKFFRALASELGFHDDTEPRKVHADNPSAINAAHNDVEIDARVQCVADAFVRLQHVNGGENLSSQQRADIFTKNCNGPLWDKLAAEVCGASILCLDLSGVT